MKIFFIKNIILSNFLKIKSFITNIFLKFDDCKICLLLIRALTCFYMFQFQLSISKWLLTNTTTYISPADNPKPPIQIIDFTDVEV